MASKKRRSYKKKGRMRSKKNFYAFTASFFAMWTMIVCPLYLENQYFNLRESKGHAFLVGAFITLLFIVISAFTDDDGLKPLIPEKKDITDWAIVVFGVLGLFSTCISGYFHDSFWGSQAWWVGGFQQICFAIFVMMLSKKLKWTDMLRYTMLTIGYITFFIGMLHSMNIDFLFLHRNTADPFSYMSTFGNVNWYVGYLCLTVPIFAVLFMKTNEKKDLLLYGIYMFLACMGIVNCKSDGTFVGIGMCAFFAIPFVMSTAQRLSRFMMVIGLFGLSNLMVAVLPAFEECRGNYDGIPAIMLKPVVAIAMLVVGVAGWFLANKFYPEENKKVVKISIIVLEGVLSLGVLYFIIDAVRNWGPMWGTQRGEIWMNAVKVFKETPFHQKLIGTGPETLHIVNAPYSQARGELVLANHSDYFQLFTTNGIIGLVAWLTMWGSIIVKFIKSKNIEGKSYMFLLPAMAYMGQALFNTMESMTWPMLMVVISLYLHYYREERKEELKLEDVE